MPQNQTETQVSDTSRTDARRFDAAAPLEPHWLAAIDCATD